MSCPLRRYPWLKRLIPGPVNALLLAAVVWLWFYPPASITTTFKPAPAITVHLLDGRELPLTRLRGQVVLVNFWATWCPWCIKEMPAIASFNRDWQARGFTVVSLSLDDNPATAREWLRQHHYPFTAGMADSMTQQAFGGIRQIPSSFVIDRNGQLREQINGQVTYGRLENLVKPLLLAPEGATAGKS